ncbi:BTAD domain-containing putative transcriptional regulator [Dactylosporangium sp. NPDC051485]|uniref:BTAD domain-containing putative transcriptional regulator n=1 Tax=Dactylosporangium sp. NPDC051485 TaxID=3154846 RepID=UPI003446E3A3
MRFGVLGPLAVWDRNGRPVPIPGAKVRALLAALLARDGRPVSADRLVEELWTGQVPGNPPAALAVKVSQLRRAIEDAEPGSRALVESGPAGFALRAATVDAAEFGALVARAANERTPDSRAALLGEALDLWRGDAYAEYRDEPFVEAVVARLEEQRLTAVEDRAEARLALGEAAAVADWLADVVSRHPLRERARSLRMLALYRAGRQSEALDAFAELRARLEDELGIDPGPDVAALHRAILAQDPALDPPEAAAAPPKPVSNLPAAMGEMFGRDSALTELAALVGAQRLVSLTGVGGVGKTRLALEVARTVQGEFRDGAWLVELAAVDGGVEAVADAVAGALGIRDAAGGNATTVDRLAAALRPRRLLLVLDNCEHVINAAATLTGRLLAAAPELRVLATSREPLRIAAELVWPVPPLDLPADGGDPGDAAAMRLFLARAAAAHRGFELQPANAALIGDLCRRLDGIPLALELAATRLRGLGIERLVAGLDDRFRLLSVGDRSAPARQQTLSATIDWSWRLLTAPERIVLRRLAVNPDGSSLDTAQAICAAGDVRAADVPDLLARLVDRSLVVRVERDGEPPRYRLLESVTAFCLERLDEAGDLDATRARWLRYYVAFATAAEAELRGPLQARWLRVLDGEAANLRAAADQAVTGGHPRSALRLVDALAWYWFLRGRLGEGRRWMRAALAASAGAPEVPERVRVAAWETGFAFLLGDVDDWPIRHKAVREALDDLTADPRHARAAWFLAYAEVDLGDVALTEAFVSELLSAFRATDDTWGSAATLTLTAKLAYIRGDTTRLVHDGDRAAGIFRQLGDGWGLLQATEWLGAHASLTGEHALATRLHREGLELARELGLWADVAGRLGWLGWLAMEHGDQEAAIRQCTQALALAQEQNAPLTVTFARMGLAWAARRAGDLDTAMRHLRTLLRDAAAQSTRAGRPLYVPSVLVELGHVAQHRGDLAAAAGQHREALKAARELGAERDVALALAALAGTAAAAGEHHAAASLLGAAQRSRASTGSTPAVADQADIERTTAAVRAALGDAFDRAFAAGRDLNPAAVTRLARVLLVDDDTVD